MFVTWRSVRQHIRTRLIQIHISGISTIYTGRLRNRAGGKAVNRNNRRDVICPWDYHLTHSSVKFSQWQGSVINHSSCQVQCQSTLYQRNYCNDVEFPHRTDSFYSMFTFHIENDFIIYFVLCWISASLKPTSKLS